MNKFSHQNNLPQNFSFSIINIKDSNQINSSFNINEVFDYNFENNMMLENNNENNQKKKKNKTNIHFNKKENLFNNDNLVDQNNSGINKNDLYDEFKITNSSTLPDINISSNEYDYTAIYNKNPNFIKSNFPIEFTELIKLVLKQFDFFLQLLLQNTLLSNDKETKNRCIKLLEKFYNDKEHILSALKIPKYDINFDFNQIFNKNQPLKIAPQISFFQAPILEICPLLSDTMKETFTTDQTISVLNEFKSFVDPIIFPLEIPKKRKTTTSDSTNEIISEDDKSSKNNNKSLDQYLLGRKKHYKFDKIQDGLLNLGLYFFSKKNIPLIKTYFLEGKTELEIRHRLKNLICFRAPENILKKQKIMTESPLNEQEFKSFLRGLTWFGYKEKWSLISRFFLPERSPYYLEKVFEVVMSLDFLVESRIKKINRIKKKKEKELTSFEIKINELATTHKNEILQILNNNYSITPSKNYFDCFKDLNNVEFQSLDLVENTCSNEFLRRYLNFDVKFNKDVLEAYEVIELD
jgi:hypothetical protein